MRNIIQFRTKWMVLLPLLFAVIILNGCAGKGGYLYQPPEKTLEKTVPFSITFDMQGNPIVLGANGKRILPSRVTFPIKDVKAIANVNTITAIEVYGSHYYVLEIGGDDYVIDLPPPHPSQ